MGYIYGVVLVTILTPILIIGYSIYWLIKGL